MFGPPHYLAAPGTKHLQVGQLYVCALSRGIFAERVIQGPNSRRDYINSKHRHAEVVECRVVIIKSHGRGWRLPEPVACIRVCGPRVETRKIGPRSPNDRSYKNPPPLANVSNATSPPRARARLGFQLLPRGSGFDVIMIVQLRLVKWALRHGRRSRRGGTSRRPSSGGFTDY